MFMIVYSYHVTMVYVSHILVLRVNILISLLMNAGNGMDGVEENHVLIRGPCIAFRSYI
jgi:hypothetical protein